MKNDYYEVIITCTGGNTEEDEFSVFDDDTQIFNTLEEVVQWVKREYGHAKRSLSYITVNGESVPCGYVFTFENSDISHYPVDKWIQRDWVNIDKIHSENAFGEIDHALSDISK